MNRLRVRDFIVGAAVIVVITALVEVLVLIFDIDPFVLPAPSTVFEELAERPQLYLEQTWTTFFETIVGFALATMFGLVGAVLITYSRLLQTILFPLIILLQIVPKVAIAPLLLIWVGFGLESKIIIALLVAFFPILVDTVTGLRAADKELLDLVRVLKGSKWQEFTEVRLPYSVPFMFSGLKVGITLAVIGAIIGEFVGANRGLGYLVVVANTELRLDMSFAAILLLSVMGFALYGSVVLAQRLIAPWSSEIAGEEIHATP
jgi:NitT/TauT family transport system permease protein